MSKITPFLWFDHNAEEAMDFYVSVFKEAKILGKQHGPDGKLFGGSFELFGQHFNVLNGGPSHAGFTEAISFFVSVSSQEELDSYWDPLLEGGSPMQCGWLRDKFGLVWQIVPDVLQTYMSDADPEKAHRTVQAMLQMVKLDFDTLKKAHDGV